MYIELGGYFRNLVRTGILIPDASPNQQVDPITSEPVSSRLGGLSNLWVVTYNQKRLDNSGMGIRRFRAALDTRCTILTIQRSFHLALNGRWGDRGRRSISPEELVWPKHEIKLKVNLGSDNFAILAISGTEHGGNGGIYANLPFIQSSLNNDRLYEEYLQILDDRSQGINPVDV